MGKNQYRKLFFNIFNQCFQKYAFIWDSFCQKYQELQMILHIKLL